MAEIYHRVKGHKLEKAIAIHHEVQSELRDHTAKVGRVAKVKLAAHRHDGHAAIEIERGDVDHYVTLSDERGQLAALSIEFGRKAGTYTTTDPNTGETIEVNLGAMDGLGILAEASRVKGRG